MNEKVLICFFFFIISFNGFALPLTEKTTCECVQTKQSIWLVIDKFVYTVVYTTNIVSNCLIGHTYFLKQTKLRLDWSLVQLSMQLQLLIIVFFYLGFFSHDIHDSQDSRGRGRPFLILLYHFHPLCKNWHFSSAIASETSPLHMASGRTRTGGGGPLVSETQYTNH